jgi:hypothetical protein
VRSVQLMVLLGRSRQQFGCKGVAWYIDASLREAVPTERLCTPHAVAENADHGRRVAFIDSRG